MAILISSATGNFLTNTTWHLVDSTSYLDSELGTETIGTVYEYTAVFTPGAITVDGVAIKLAARVASPVGTITLQLYNNTDTVEVTTVVLNVSDLPTCGTTDKEGGWVFFKFGSSQLLIAAKAYKIGLKCSTVSEITTYRNATAQNHSRMLRTTTDQAPIAGDVLHVMGEHTGQGTGNNISVVMNETVANDYGVGTDAVAALTVSKRGTLSYGYAGATNYYLKLSGNLVVYNGGTFNIGTVTNPIPRDSTAILEFDPVLVGGMGLFACNNSIFIAQGLSRTINKNIVSCKLNTNEAINSTSLGVDTDTGWKDNDVIAIASTTQTSTQSEVGALNGDATATVLTVDGFAGEAGGLAFAHSGTLPTQAEVILITRNVCIRSATTSKHFQAKFSPTSVVNMDWVEARYVDVFTIETTTGSFSFDYCSFSDVRVSSYGLYKIGSATAAISITYLTAWLNQIGYSCAIFDNSTVGASVYDNIVVLTGGLNSASFGAIQLSNVLTHLTNVTAAGCSLGISRNSSSPSVLSGTTNNILAHSCSSGGIGFGFVSNGVVSNIISWHNSVLWAGLYLNNCSRMIFNTGLVFGNSGGSIYLQTNNSLITFNNFDSGGDSSFATEFAVYTGNGARNVAIRFNSCDFSGVNVPTIGVAHSTAIVTTSGGALGYMNMLFNNCVCGVTTIINNMRVYGDKASALYFTRHQQQDGHYLTIKYDGTIEEDTIYFNTVTPSVKLTPLDAVYKLESGSKKFAIDANNTAVVSVYVRKSSVAAGGANYGGNPPRLILKRNDAMGITADQILDTMTAGLNIWEQLSGTTPAVTDNGVLEVVVDCDGTTGFINVDDWSIE